MCGFGLYEWRARELLKVSKDKWALKFIEKRMGTHICAKRKSGAGSVLAATRKAAAKEDWAPHPVGGIEPFRKLKKESTQTP